MNNKEDKKSMKKPFEEEEKVPQDVINERSH